MEAFAEQMLGVLNDAMLALMTSIGHQTGLFDTMADLPPSTSEEIASAAKLKERYVREWLGAMVVGDVVTYDPPARPTDSRRSTPPASRVPPAPTTLRTSRSSLVLGNVEEGIVQSFRNGGGVPYSSFTRFQEIMAEDSAQVYGATLIGGTLPIVPGLVERLEVGSLPRTSGADMVSRPTSWPGPSRTAVSWATISEEGIAAARLKAEIWDSITFASRSRTRGVLKREIATSSSRRLT